MLSKRHGFRCIMGVISLSWPSSGKFTLIGIQLHIRFVTEWDIIPHFITHFTFKYFLFKDGFFVETNLFVLSTGNKLKRSDSCINCPSVFLFFFFHWVFSDLDQPQYYPMLQISIKAIVWLIQNASSAFRHVDFWDDASLHYKFLGHYSRVHILGHYHYLHPDFFRSFRHDFK